jgi:hypothetical protein
VDKEVLEEVRALRTDLQRHSNESRDRETRIVNRVNELAVLAQKALDKAEAAHAHASLAHSEALDAKRSAGQVSIDAEGNDHNIFAELGSLKVVLAEHTNKLEAQKKIDAKARRFWRLAQPALIAAVLAILNYISNALGPSALTHAPTMHDAGSEQK